MTKATKQATVEEYMDLVKAQGDVDTFLGECFGTGDDFDNEACNKFADEVQPVIEEFLMAEIASAQEATPDMMPSDEAATEKTDDTDEVAESAVEAPVKGE